jgi:hypothetical protein
MKNHPVNNDYVQNLVEGLIQEGVVKNLVGAATGPKAKEIYKKGAAVLGSAGEVVGDFVSGGAEKAAPGAKDKFGNLVRVAKNRGKELVKKGVDAAHEWSKTPDENPDENRDKDADQNPDQNRDKNPDQNRDENPEEKVDESKAHIRRQLKSKNISPEEKAKLRAKLDAKEVDSEAREEAAQEAADEEYGDSGGFHAKWAVHAGNEQGNIRDQGGSPRQPRKVKGQK